MAKPKVDEYLMHYRNIVNIMKRHKKVVIYALPGEGKTTLLKTLEEKYKTEGWNFYEWGDVDLQEPYVYELPHVDLPRYANVELPVGFDLIYVIQYSREYKEAITGVSFGDEYRPLSDYVRKMKYKKAHKTNLGGRRFKSIEDLRKALQGE